MKRNIGELFIKAKPKITDNVLAIISPHAGYVYSGEVAASGFNQLDANKEYKNIFIIGSSHTTSFHGASIYSVGNYITPLGEVPVNIPLAEKLIQENDFFSFNKQAHVREHSLEVEIPFLQYLHSIIWLSTDFNPNVSNRPQYVYPVCTLYRCNNLPFLAFLPI